jgi:CRP/FNR family transcriptional regulator, cyclic AMP receptor protein
MDNQPDIIALLKTIPIFLDLKPNQLARLASATTVAELEISVELITEGDPLDFFYIVLEGDMLVEVYVPSIGKIETSHLGPLDICGWSGLTPIVRTRTGTVTTLTFCRLLKMDSRLIIPMCEEDHDIGFTIYRRIANVAARSFLTTRLQLMNLIVKASQANLNQKVD